MEARINGFISSTKNFSFPSYVFNVRNTDFPGKYKKITAKNLNGKLASEIEFKTFYNEYRLPLIIFPNSYKLNLN